MTNYRQISNKFTDIIASNLNYQDFAARAGENPINVREVIDAQEGWEARYRNDPRFRARVDCLVASLMTVIDTPCSPSTNQTKSEP